ncbi:MAG: hypothetical protein KAU20_00530, partial [Nanoarchaeota archaeon]|nr:hypothetical protein [Nanoarchaeota archaeon]
NAPQHAQDLIEFIEFEWDRYIKNGHDLSKSHPISSAVVRLRNLYLQLQDLREKSSSEILQS